MKPQLNTSSFPRKFSYLVYDLHTIINLILPKRLFSTIGLSEIDKTSLAASKK